MYVWVFTLSNTFRKEMFSCWNNSLKEVLTLRPKANFQQNHFVKFEIPRYDFTILINVKNSLSLEMT